MWVPLIPDQQRWYRERQEYFEVQKEKSNSHLELIPWPFPDNRAFLPITREIQSYYAFHPPRASLARETHRLLRQRWAAIGFDDPSHGIT